ncbi:restriction endonuclease [Cellulomonas sp. PS-H5]|nr:restriction endonuclease [Cellulomonas sp. PS-H5]
MLQRLRDGDGQFFECTLRRLLTAIVCGTDRAKLRTTRSGDGGVDGVINRHALGSDLIHLQAERFRESP